MVLESANLFTPKASKLKPDDPPGFYARVLADAKAVKAPEWAEMEKAVKGLGAQSFGGPAKFEALVQAGQFRSPLRRDVIGKGFPDSTVAFLNVKCSRDYPPRILAPDNTEIMDQTLIYPGCIVRVSLRIYAYGGPGTQYPAGISFGLENLKKVADGPRLTNARLDRVLPPLSPTERKIWEATEHLNDRGVLCDQDLLRRLVRISEAARRGLDAQISRLTDGAVPRISNHGALTRWLIAQGLAVAGAARDIVEALLARIMHDNRRP
jgi:Protein of unknown function (DUF2815)